MGNKVRHLLGSAFVRHAISVFVSIVSAHQTFGGSVTSGNGPWPANGCLKVTVDAPNGVKSAIQWGISPYANSWYPVSDWHNNGDMASVGPGSYYVSFRPIAGWEMPATGQASVSSNSTNTISFGSCSFVSLSGDYQGLFSDPSGPKYESSGFCEIFGGKGSSFTGKISSAGHKYPFSGSFDQSGNAWTTIPRAGASPLSVHLVAGDDSLTGEISNET